MFIDKESNVATVRQSSKPAVSVIMPVHNTGTVLIAAVRSVLDQELFGSIAAPSWELLIVDDLSDDQATRVALEEVASLSPCVRVVSNVRSRGAAGARNTGVFAAIGTWVAFLDSDDLWYPGFMSQQFAAFESLPDARWRAAHFHTGNGDAVPKVVALRDRSPCLFREIERSYRAGEVAILRKPVDVLLRCGCIQVMTVQIATELIRSVGGFDETLECAEDYDLWLRLALTEDLYIAPIDAGVYRIREGSLTRSGRPMYFGEDRMLLAARANGGFDRYRAAIDDRLEKVFEKFCFDYRSQGRFGKALRIATRMIRLRPTAPQGWRQLVATALRR